jgi:3-deoxy-D-manno-octulosonate 8-phosphate phosphatase (KDO 8-P phosphatase)
MDIFKKIRAVALDVDGVLTDGTFWWGTNGEEFKRFCFADSTGITQALRAGIKIALISGESSQSGMTLVQRYADKLKISNVYKGCHDKAEAIRDFAQKNGLALSEICFIGDDFIDMPAMSIVGLSATPANAQSLARSKAQFVCKRDGGHGAVRELLDAILATSTTLES